MRMKKTSQDYPFINYVADLRSSVLVLQGYII